MYNYRSFPLKIEQDQGVFKAMCLIGTSKESGNLQLVANFRPNCHFKGILSKIAYRNKTFKYDSTCNSVFDLVDRLDIFNNIYLKT